jgi:hypothetical protein
MTISRTPTGGRGRQGLAVARSQASRVRLLRAERCSNSGWPTWPKCSPTKRGHPALLDGAVTGSGLKSSNYGRKERIACTIGSATRLRREAGGSSGYHPDNLVRRKGNIGIGAAPLGCTLLRSHRSRSPALRRAPARHEKDTRAQKRHEIPVFSGHSW